MPHYKQFDIQVDGSDIIFNAAPISPGDETLIFGSAQDLQIIPAIAQLVMIDMEIIKMNNAGHSVFEDFILKLSGAEIKFNSLALNNAIESIIAVYSLDNF